MIHPLFKLLVSQPELVAHHLAGYSHLVAVQASEAATHLRTRAVLAGVAVVCLALGLGVGCIALLFLAAIPLDAMPMPWLLALVPLTPLVIAVACGFILRSRPAVWSLESLREQWAADAALLREVSAR